MDKILIFKSLQIEVDKKVANNVKFSFDRTEPILNADGIKTSLFLN